MDLLVAIETTTRTYCWDELDHISSQLAYWLHSLGLPQGARVAVQVEKTPEALLLYLATLRAGLVYLPLNTAYSASEVDYFLGDAQPAVFSRGQSTSALVKTIGTSPSNRACADLRGRWHG